MTLNDHDKVGIQRPSVGCVASGKRKRIHVFLSFGQPNHKTQSHEKTRWHTSESSRFKHEQRGPQSFLHCPTSWVQQMSGKEVVLFLGWHGSVVKSLRVGCAMLLEVIGRDSVLRIRSRTIMTPSALQTCSWQGILVLKPCLANMWPQPSEGKSNLRLCSCARWASIACHIISEYWVLKPEDYT
jgi:hypothetical protein